MVELFEFGMCNKFFPDSTLHAVISFFAVFIIGYLLGSLNFGVIISKLLYNDDVRNHGSKSAGMTNMLRTYGKLPAAMTFLGDILKTVAAVWIGALLLGMHNTVFYAKDGVIYSNLEELLRGLYEIYGEHSKIPSDLSSIGVVSYDGYAGMYIGGMASMIGHAFPVYYKLKGGKSVVAATAMILCTEPLICLILLVMFVVIVAVTKFISLGSVMCIIIYPLILNRMTGPGIHNLIAIFAMLFVVYLHRANIKRLLNGQENKLSLKSRKKDADNGGESENENGEEST